MLAVTKHVTDRAVIAFLGSSQGLSIGRGEHVFLLENGPAGLCDLVDPIKLHELPHVTDVLGAAGKLTEGITFAMVSSDPPTAAVQIL